MDKIWIFRLNDCKTKDFVQTKRKVETIPTYRKAETIPTYRKVYTLKIANKKEKNLSD